MNRIIIIDQRTDVLGKKVATLLPQALVKTDFQWQPHPKDVICWLADDNARVDVAVSDLVNLLDHWHIQPAKIVMKSIAGTADDASAQQLTAWYGQEASQHVADHLYAIKMIDELEFPYTIVRTLPLTNEPVNRQLLAEGQSMNGQFSNIDAVAKVIAQACHPDQLKNVSVGI